MQAVEARIRLNTIVQNAALIERRAERELIAVVKDDAYGHGAERVSLALEPHVAAFAVATAGEGAALRFAGVQKPVLVLSPCLSEEEILFCDGCALIPTVSSGPAMKLLLRTAERRGFLPQAQLAVNTGMNRYGVPPGEVKRVCRAAKRAGLRFVGVFSHFYAPEDVAARERQYALFSGAASEAKEIFPEAVRHLSATGGILAGPKYGFDAVRPGIALYGYLPAGFEGALPVKPAMSLYASVAHAAPFTEGGAGYARAERRYGALNTLRAGYGDGLFRDAPLGIGKLCMDALIREGGAPFGKKELLLRDFSDYAKAHGTTVYEALTSLSKRVERVYL